MRIRRNRDDDDGDGVPDRSDTNGVPGETDLIEVQLEATAGLPGAEIVVRRTGFSGLTLYRDSTKSVEVMFNFADSTVLTAGGTYWVEYTDISGAAELALSLRDTRHQREVLLDTLTFSPINSIVIAILGNLQTAQWPPPATTLSPGLYSTPYELYTEGYDVYLYEYSDVGIGTGHGPASTLSPMR